MAAQYMGDVCTITGKYNDQQGNEKNRYLKVGAWFDNEGRISVKLEAIPLPDPNGNVWLSLFLRQDDNSNQQQPAPQQQQQRQAPPPQQQNNNQRRSRY
jgi:hypothetical protein